MVNIGTHLKHNKYIFDIPIPFCHNLYLSATLKQFLTEFAARYNLLHHGSAKFNIFSHNWLDQSIYMSTGRLNLLNYVDICTCQAFTQS
jgi:hypothetical protein